MPPPSRQHRLRSPLRSKSPAFNEFNAIPVISEAKLVRVIQTLDTTRKSMNLQFLASANEETKSSPLSDALREAFSTLLEIVACLGKPDLMNKAHVVTVCTARVLGCLRRFVAGDVVMELGGCCERKCEQRLIHLTLLSILFRMCREPEIASNVVKEDLHKFLIKMCVTNMTQNPAIDKNSADIQDEQAFDPNDLTITIDPFDWCYQPLCTRLLKENQHSFFIPMGIRSLICLLHGMSLPIDEVSEFEQHIQGRGGIREKSPKRRKLPSIFTFPQNENGSERATKQSPQMKFTPLCCESISLHRENRGLWMLVLNDNSRMHLALRSLIMLAICVPRLSLEYKYLLRERDYIRRVLNVHSSTISTFHNLENALAWVNSLHGETSQVDLLPFQLIATHERTLKRIAHSALQLFADEQIEIPKQHISTNERRTLSPLKKKPGFPGGPHNQKDFEPLLIQRRLNAASEAAHSEIIRQENKFHYRGTELERNHQRLAVRKMCADVESLRDHLIGSLEVLCSGRQHPDPHQPFSEWIKSLPTLETFERERQYQQEMRQRQVLEQQYQREAQRRRERDECVQMYLNDYNVPEENELSIQKQKHEQFLRMQAEMREFEQHDLDDDTLNPITDTRIPTKKEKLAIQERQRSQQLEDQRREYRELERMRREDLYYVEHILKSKAKAIEEQDKRPVVKSAKLQKNVIEEQQKHIARMRLLDEEKRLTEREICGMRLEDLFGRQMRFREAEKAKEELHNEWRERKSMQVEEHDCRTRWVLWDRALVQQHQEEIKQQRAEARRLRRQQLREEKEIRAAWVETWDENGNKYFYNAVTGVSQWEVPT